MKRILTGLVLGLSLAVWGSVGVGQDFDKGWAAYERGDYATAFKEWRPLAEQGDADAQYNLGLMYDNGYGVTQDYAEAIKWYRLAAEQGDAYAQNNLGLMYNEGYRVTQDYAEAVKWYRLAAEQGDAYAQNNLGGMYALGQGVIQDNVYAHMWANIAASLGNENGRKARDLVAKQMTSAQLAKAEILARNCFLKNYKGC